MINVEIDQVIARPGAVGLRWSKQDHLSQRLKVVKRVEESTSITSFYLEPADGLALEPFEAGQHLPVEMQIPGQVGTSKRSYSLSGNPDDLSQYRLSIKREDKGLVSRFFHDELRVGSVIEARTPAGDFVIPCSKCPLVLISAGVGLTPMLAALYANAQQSDREVWYVHGARNGRDHAFKPEVHKRIFYSQPAAEDVLGRDYDLQGRITAEQIIDLGAGPDACYMLCGPAQFLADMRSGLEASGTPPAKIHFETFGPTG